MGEGKKGIWHDPVWSKVISALILAGGGWAFLKIPGVWEFVKAVWRQCVTWLMASSLQPNWLMLALYLAAAIVLLLLILLLLEMRGEKGSRLATDWRSYRSDVFESVRWRWNYSSGGQVTKLQPHCPYCDCEIRPYDVGFGRTKLHCDMCRQVSVTSELAWHALEDRVTRFIVQRANTGKWLTEAAPDPLASRS